MPTLTAATALQPYTPGQGQRLPLADGDAGRIIPVTP